MTTGGWKPRCALRVGVVGNRRLEGMEGVVVQKAGEVWKTLIASIGNVLDRDYAGVRMRDLFSGETPRLAVLSSLAAGADQIGARAALDAAGGQTNVAVELEALLPFSEEYYPGPQGSPRREFTEDDAGELRRLAASATQVVRLDGDYNNEESRRRAYRQARDFLLQNSDILIAIYDPDAAGGEAGTLETVELALQSNTPVIAVHVGTEARIGVARSMARWISDPDWTQSVEECVREQLVLPELVWPVKDKESLDHALERLQLVANVDAASQLCMNTTLGGIFRRTWSALRWLTSFAATSKAQAQLSAAEALPDPRDGITLEPYAGLYEPSSKLAEAFMRTYRGAFVWSYFLAGLAVAAAVAMMLATILTDGRPSHLLVTILFVVKVVIIGLLLWLERAGRERGLHEAAVDFRYLAELLRPMQWLSPVGVYPPAVDLPLHSASDDLRRSWMAWLVRAAARSSPSVSANMEHHPPEIAITGNLAADALDRARTEWIEGQVVYHARNSARMEALGEGLEHLAKTLLWIVLGAAIAAFVLEWSGCAEPVAAVLGALAAILPAFIAAVIGIAFQSEAKRLAKRSEAMRDALRGQQRELEEIAARLRTGGANHGDVTAILKKLSAITIVEAADWKILYQVHEIRAS